MKRVKDRHRVTGAMLQKVLLSHGGDRPNTDNVFPLNEGGENIVAKFAKFVYMDPHFILSKKHLQTRNKSIIDFDYTDIVELVEVLEAWRDENTGPGRHEAFCGTLTGFIPLHHPSELHYLASEWGNLKCLLRLTLTGYNSEREPKTLDYGPPKEVEENTFGSNGNTLHEHSIPWSWTYQPIEEIRDYYGDDVGMYCEWLNFYASSLLINALLGTVVMVSQPFFGNVDDNPLTLPYSVYVGLWSIGFVESWTRRQNELQFLWGSDLSLDSDTCRYQFEGRLEIHSQTGREQMVPHNNTTHFLKQALSITVCFLCICCAVGTAIATTMFSNLLSTLYGGNFTLFSSFLTLFAIAVFKVVYDVISKRLTDYENHRLDRDYERSLVAKRFAFNFFNNCALPSEHPSGLLCVQLQ